MEWVTFSKDIEVLRTMTYHLQPNEKRERKRSIYMSLMINSLRLGMGGVWFGFEVLAAEPKLYRGLQQVLLSMQ